MMLVQTENPLVAVRWPEGARAQDEARIQLTAAGVEYNLYDINVEHAPKDEPFEDGSFFHWHTVAPVRGDWVKVGQWALILPGGKVIAVSDEEFRRDYREMEQEQA